VVPASADDPQAVRRAVATGPAVLMKVGDRAGSLHSILVEAGRAHAAVLAVKVGLEGQRFLRGQELSEVEGDAAYLSLVLAPEVAA